ncbi:uncharacterized protein LOC135843844 [Planococcus citri]|uniref:uncharacterized protein LOC135843844 n=1 Tax=Planococcus citri TaxID=170843 RepID=UPI0031F8EB26
MSQSEKNIYLNFTKSIVDGFEEFVTNVEKHDAVIGDNELKCKLKLISKKLQTIFNKWENTPDKKNTNMNNSTVEESSTRAVIKTIDTKPETLKRSKSWDEFESMIASSVGDTEPAPISKVSTTEISSSTSSKLEFSILDCLTTLVSKMDESETPTSNDNSPPLTRKEAEIIRKFKIENVKEEWVRGSNGFYVEQIQPGTWKCKPCDLPALSYANIISHVSGKAHFKKICYYNRDSRDSSETRRSKNDITVNTDLSDILSDIEPDLMKKDNGADIIVPFKGYYCNACCGTLNSEEALRLHVTGGKHRKNCES